MMVRSATHLNLRTMFCLVLPGAAVGISGRGSAAESALELPTYTVTAERELPPPETWHYARVAGFEVLSGASESATRDLLKNFQDFVFAIDQIWPGVRPGQPGSAALIICGERNKFAALIPDAQKSRLHTTSFHLRARERSFIAIDEQTKFLETPGAAAVDPVVEESIAPSITVETQQVLHREYVRYLLSARNPAALPWLAEGISQLLTKMHISSTEISIGQVENPNEQAEPPTGLADSLPPPPPPRDHDFNYSLRNLRLSPMDEFFAVAADAPETRTGRSKWAKQCYAFVHWGLYGEFGANQGAFIKFLRRLDREPLTEQLFKDCFGQSYAEVIETLQSHIISTRFKFAGVRAEKGKKIQWPAPPIVREASQAEIGRLLGDALELAGQSAQARETMLLAYLRGERDPCLLGALGEFEARHGDQQKARKLLESAVGANVQRPRAYVALAELRMADARRDGFDEPHIKAVLTPLLAARAIEPALPETYLAISALWSASPSSAKPDDLAVLDEGVRLFPGEAELIYANAVLQAKAGRVETAESLIKHGLRVSRDGAMRDKFARLRSAITTTVGPSPKG